MTGMPYGLQAMLKEGHKHFSGVDEAVSKNINACKTLAHMTRTSLGPNGAAKLVVNHLGRLFVTSDASTVVSELEVHHPAAKLLVMAARAQAGEVGDGTNLVLTLAGELLTRAEDLLRDGLTATEIADGYARAAETALEALEAQVLAGSDQLDTRDVEAVAARLRGVVSSKQPGSEATIAALASEACVAVAPAAGAGASFNVDDVRVLKLQGGALADSHVVRGLVLKRGVEGSVTSVEDTKVAVFAQGVDTAGTETKGTVLLRTAGELENYAASEETALRAQVDAIVASGARVVVSGGTVGEMAASLLDAAGVLVLRVPSKFELRRLCRATGAVAVATMRTPAADELGFAKRVEAIEIGGSACVVVQQDAALGGIATVVLRGATEGQLDDVERAVDDAVNGYRTLCRDARSVPAGGAAELGMSRRVASWARGLPGLSQYAGRAFAAALEAVPRALAENGGASGDEALAQLHAAHAAGQVTAGVSSDDGAPKDLAATEGIVDLMATKWWAVKLAADAAATVLRVDQIIMAKQAGGPAPRGPGGDDD